MKEKWNIWLPVLLMVVFALSRWPGWLPEGMANFSAAYALAFCCGVYFPGRLAWWLPLTTLLISDLLINLTVYNGIKAFNYSHLFNYASYAVIILLGRKFKPTASLTRLLGGGVLGAILFYLITNTASWLFNPFHNPEYTKNLAGWIIALTKGTAGFPPTWEFFRNTLLSGGLFTGLFVGAMKLSAKMESEQEKEAQEEPEEEPAEAAPEESKA